MPSDTPDVLEKLKKLGQCVRMQLAGHRVTVLLTDYDLSSDTYHGEAHRNYSMNTDEKTPVVESVHGIRFYPYDARPNYAFQCVPCGEDEQPLIDIARGNMTDASKVLTSDPFGKPEEQSPGHGAPPTKQPPVFSGPNASGGFLEPEPAPAPTLKRGDKEYPAEADTDKSGDISKREAKDWDKSH